jgi:hypothetical protein
MQIHVRSDLCNLISVRPLGLLHAIGSETQLLSDVFQLAHGDAPPPFNKQDAHTLLVLRLVSERKIELTLRPGQHGVVVLATRSPAALEGFELCGSGFFVLLPRTRAPLLHVGGEQGEEGEEGEQGEQGEQGEEGEQRERREQQEAREQREANERRAASAAHARVQQTVHYHLNAALSEIESAFQACR